MLQLHLQFFDVDDVGHAHRGVPVEKRERHARFGEMLPDELQHQQLVEVGIEQRPDDRVEFPVVVMRAFSEVNDHSSGSLIRIV